MSDIETRNAIIESATIINDDRGLLSAWLGLDYGGSGQGFGGYALYLPKDYAHHGGPNYARKHKQIHGLTAPNLEGRNHGEHNRCCQMVAV